MAVDETKPDFSVVLDLMEAFRRSKTMFAAVSLGVFDSLATGSKGASQLATELGTSADGLERLLDACVGLQLLVRKGNVYDNSAAASTYLCNSSADRVTGYINYSNNVMWKLWSHLEDAVREGTHRWNQVYGWDGPIFSHFFRTEEAKREFIMGMHGFGLVSSPPVVSAFDLSGYECFVDLGAATGHLAVAACQRYAQLRGVVFDLPDAIPMAREYVSDSRVAHRIEFASGDFFTDPLPLGDLYALGRILHDWSERKILILLKRIFDCLPSDGAILIAEKLLTDDKTGPRWAHMQSLNMLTCTEGKERNLEEYAVLLENIGFHRVRACRTSSPLDAVMATKP